MSKAAINKLQQPVAYSAGLPVFAVVLIPPTRKGTSFRGQLAFRCPRCEEYIYRGGGTERSDEDQHRVSHCGCWKGGYFIREVQESHV